MNDRQGLSPFGTVRERFEQERGRSGPDPMSAFLQQLRTGLPLFAMEEEVVQIAWEMVAWQQGLTVPQKQALLLAVIASMIAAQQGSTRIPLATDDGRHYLQGLFRTLLGGGQAGALTDREAMELLDAALAGGTADAFLGGREDFKPLLLADGCLYQYRMHRLEERFVQKLKAVLAGAAEGFPAGAVDRALEAAASGPQVLSEEQLAAVRLAVTSTFCIITGGPGTGKTSVVASILRAFLALGVPAEAIALAAPTGKAANRMGESVRMTLEDGDRSDGRKGKVGEPRTLHRLLGYSPATDRFRHHRGNPLSEQVVIVDEGSMIDLFLMERLLGSLGAGTRLVLIGDADQLPSVEAGAVLRDLTAQGRDRPGQRFTARLTKNYRMDAGDEAGRNILSAARAIRESSAGGLFDEPAKEQISLREAVEDIEFRKVELYDTRGDRKSLVHFLDRWRRFTGAADGSFERLVRKEYRSGREGFGPDDAADLRELFRQASGSRILCLTAVHDTGTDAINRHFHALLLKRSGLDSPAEFLPGEPVMMRRNDYGRDLFNGDQGIVLRVADENGAQHFMAVFPRGSGFAAYHLGPLRASLMHAFAVTVHKSQGSEHDHVAIILPDRLIPIVTREILYTAVTRSRRSATIIGSRELLTEGAGRGILRFSGIAERMAAP